MLILDLSNKEHRLSLGIKQVTDNPWKTIGEEYESGKIVKGSILKVIEKGAIVELGNNIEGIIPFKNLSKDEKKVIKDIFVPDYEIEAQVQEVDEELKKIILVIDFSPYINQSENDSEE